MRIWSAVLCAHIISLCGRTHFCLIMRFDLPNTFRYRVGVLGRVERVFEHWFLKCLKKENLTSYKHPIYCLEYSADTHENTYKMAVAEASKFF